MSGAVGSIVSNFGALEALNGIAAAQQANNTYETQLSSGLSINSPADNPAGFIQAQGFTSQINGITQAASNANEGISLLQTAQGAVQQQLDIAQKLNSIAVQAANGTQTPQEAQSLQGVVSQLSSQITTIAQQTQFNNINLLDGTFSGVQFQVGANAGQTIDLSIGSTQAANLGMYTLKDSTTSLMYQTQTGGSGSGAISAAAGAFTAGALTITGSNGTSPPINVTGSESAYSIATAVNATANTTNVSAQATTQIAVALSGTTTGYAFTLGNGTSSAQITGTSMSSVVNAVNAQTANTGITATVQAAASGSSVTGNIVLTQSQGKNISITNTSNTTGGYGTLTATTGSAVPVSVAAAPGTTANTLLVQGKVSFQSDAAFSVANASGIGLASTSTLDTLSGINVSTTGGANTAINVVKYAIEGLNNLGGQLGATQQRLSATLSNLTTTSMNLQNGLSVVQDANIPAVSQRLTQSQIQAQAGVAALKSSTTLQQAYLSLLP